MDEIYVELYPTPVAFIAEAFITPFSHARLHAFSMESYVDAIAELRRGLAYLGEVGRMELTLNYRLFNNEAEEKQIDAAFALHADELTITPEYVQQVKGR
jgi:hypothetical protein